MEKHQAIHVGLNAHLLSRRAGYRRAGIHHYIQQLIHYLPAADEGLRVTVFAGQAGTGERTGASAVSWRASRWPTHQPWSRIVWEQFALPWALHRSGIDLVHAPAFVSPLLTPVPAVVTIHDLSFIRFPRWFRPANRLYLSVMTRRTCRQARRIIAVSQATARETVELLGVPAERIDVIPHGVEHDHFRPLPSDKVEAFRQQKGLPEHFILYLGTLEPRKNLTTLIEAFAHTTARKRGIKLIVAGAKGWYYREVFERVGQLGLAGTVRFPGFVHDIELPLWYNAATAFVYPSLYEGFGMPLLEAMACGVPVIGANASCIPEVVGDAGLLFSPVCAGGLRDSLEHLLTDADLQKELSARGRQRAAGYTWRATCQATMTSYLRALGC